MPRGVKRTVLQVELPDDEGRTEGRSEERTAEELESDSILEEVRSEQPKHPLEIVYRADDDTGEEGWVGKFPASAVTPEFLSRRFGPGRYKCYTRKPDKNGKMGFGGSRVVNVVSDLRAAVQTGTPPASSDGGRGGSLGETLLISMMKQQSESAAQSMQMMQGLFTALTGAMTALKPSAPAVDPVMLEVLRGTINRKDPTEIATALLGVMRENSPGGKDPIEQIKQLLEIREMLGGGESPADPETTMIMKGMETLQSLFAGGRAFAPSSAPSSAPRQLPAPVSPPVPVAPSPSPESMPVPSVDPNLRAWKRGVAENFTMLMRAAAFMPPVAAALTAKEQMQLAGVWADLVEDVRSDPTTVADDEFGIAFMERSAKDLHLDTVPEEVREWAREVLYELAELAVEVEVGEEQSGPEAPHA